MNKFVYLTVIMVLIFVPSFVCSQETVPLTEPQMHSALKSANPDYTGRGKIYKGKVGNIWGVDVSNCRISSLEPLRGMKLEAVACGQNDIKDISPLAGMNLKQFSCQQTSIEDLSLLAGMPLWTIDITETNVTDITPLKGMSLQMISFNPQKIINGIEVLKEMKSLSIIFTETDRDAGKGTHLRVGIGPDKFWEQYNRGDFKSNK